MLSISYCITDNVLQRFSDVVYALKRQDRTFHRFGGYVIAIETKGLGHVAFFVKKGFRYDTLYLFYHHFVLFSKFSEKHNAAMMFLCFTKKSKRSFNNQLFSLRVNYLLDLQPSINTLVLLYLFSLAYIANSLIFQLLSSVFQLIVILSCF